MFQSKAHNPATGLIIILFCSIFLFSCAAPPPVKNTVVQQKLQLAGAKWYHFTATAKVDDNDLRNDAPLFCIKFDFAQPGKRSFRDTYLAISADMKTAYKYIYAENLKKRPDGLYDLAFQFKTPANVTTGTVLASGWKNRYPVTISNFAVKENNGSIRYLTGTPLKKQFAVNKFIDTLKISGSVKMKDSSRRLPEKKVIISLKANDSLHRPLKFAPALPWSAAAKSNFIYVVPDKNGNFSHSIKLPQGVASMEIALQTVYFKETVELTDLKVEQLFTPQKLTERELSFDQAVSGGSTVCLNGIISDNDKLPESKSAFAKIIFSDKNGKQLPSPGLAYNRKKKYYYCYLPQQAGQERFSIALQVPHDAVKMQVKLARFYNNAPLTLQSFYIEETIPPLNQRLRNAGIDLTPGYMENGAILDQLWNCFMPEVSLETLINAPVFTKLPLPVGHGYIFDGRDDPRFVSLKDFRPYKLPRSLFWTENPFSHSTWQQKFYTLYWAVMNDQRYDDARYITRIMKSFFKHTPYLYSQNPLCYEDHAISCRIEAMLALYHGVNSDVFKVIAFNGIKSKREFLIRDKFFMKQFFIQMLLDAENIYGLLKNQTLGIHNHNLFMAHALLCLSDAFPQLPRAGVYKKTALETINSHLLQMYENDNITAEQSSAYQHTFLMFFCEIYSYLRQSGYANPELLSNLYNKIKFMFGAAVDMLDYDNKFFTIGDSANASFSQLEFAAIQQLLHKQNPSKIVIAEQNRTEQNRTEQNRTEQNRTEQNRTEQNRTEQNRTEQNIPGKRHICFFQPR